MDGAKNGKPLLLYLSSHNFGAYYAWNDTGYRFDLVRGESPKQKVLAARCRSKKKQKKNQQTRRLDGRRSISSIAFLQISRKFSLQFTRFYWVLLGFTGFYWVLLSLTV